MLSHTFLHVEIIIFFPTSVFNKFNGCVDRDILCISIFRHLHIGCRRGSVSAISSYFWFWYAIKMDNTRRPLHLQWLVVALRTAESCSRFLFVFSGSLPNILISSCDDNMCRIWCETLTPEMDIAKFAAASCTVNKPQHPKKRPTHKSEKHLGNLADVKKVCSQFTVFVCWWCWQPQATGQ